MENDQRLTPLPLATDIQPAHIEVSGPYAPSYDGVLDSKRSLRQYFNVVYKRLPIILAISIVVTAAVAFYMYQQPSIYLARTEMIIEPRRPPQTKKDAININFGDDSKYYSTQLQLLQNADLMRRVVIALGLHREANALGTPHVGIVSRLRSIFSGGPKPASSTNNSLPIVSDNATPDNKDSQVQLTPEESARADAYAAELAGHLKVDAQQGTNIVYISLENSNPALAARVTDKVADLFIAEDRERETSGAKKSLDDLNASIEQLKNTIDGENAAYIDAMRRGNLPLAEKGSELRAQDLEALLGQLRKAQIETTQLETQYSAALGASRTGDIMAVIPTGPLLEAQSENIKHAHDLEKRVEDLDKKINDAEEAREKLLARYTTEYREVKVVDAQLETLRKQRTNVQSEVQNEVNTAATKLKADATHQTLTGLQAALGAARQRESKAQYEYETAAAKANVEGVAETELTGKKQELDTNRSLLVAYIQRQKEQELALESGTPDNIKVQNHAVTPSEPIGPQRSRNIVVALLLSLGAGVGLAFLLDYLDDSVRTSDDVTRHLGLPTLALIPQYSGHGDNKKKLLTGKSGAGGAPGTALITMDERHSPMAEAYRHLRTSLLFSSAGKPPQTILVTSSQPSEGKTTTAINTAITLAQSDAEVVIIDCDLRRPRLHSHFNLENTRGLTNYLSGDKDTAGLIRTYEDLPNLKIITSGPIPPNPAELLSSNEMRNLLQFLSGKFKHVIIDSPPAISFTDATILSTLVDGVVLVAMANKSSIHLMRQFKQRVHNIGARIYGVVLNGIQAGSTEYYYYGSGYYNYYSRPNDDESTPFLDDTER